MGPKELTQSRLIPIHFQRWFRSRLIWIMQLRFAHEEKGMAYMHMSTIDSERTSPGYTLCSAYLLISRSNTMAG